MTETASDTVPTSLSLTAMPVQAFSVMPLATRWGLVTNRSSPTVVNEPPSSEVKLDQPFQSSSCKASSNKRRRYWLFKSRRYSIHSAVSIGLERSLIVYRPSLKKELAATSSPSSTSTDGFLWTSVMDSTRISKASRLVNKLGAK